MLLFSKSNAIACIFSILNVPVPVPAMFRSEFRYFYFKFINTPYK